MRGFRPVTSGVQYINELRKELTDENNPKGNGELNSNYQDCKGVINFNGFALHIKMQETLKKLNVLNIDMSAISKVRHIISHQSIDSQEFTQKIPGQPFRAHLPPVRRRAPPLGSR